MNRFFKELLLTARVVSLGRTDDAVARILSIRRERLLGFEAAMAFVIGIFLGVQSLSPLKFLGTPLFLVGITLIGAYLFAAFGEIAREQMLDIHSLFLGSSLFLLPGIIPLVGPVLMQALLVGWPFVLARFLARYLGRPPGRVFLQLCLPPALLWLILQLVFVVVGRVLFFNAGDSIGMRGPGRF